MLFASLTIAAEEYVVVVATFGSLDRAEVQKKELTKSYNDIRIKPLQDKYIVMVAGFDNLQDAKSASQKLVNQFKDCFIATYKEPTKIIDKPSADNNSEAESDGVGVGTILAGLLGLFVCWHILKALVAGDSGDRKCPECKSNKVSIKSTETKEGLNMKTKKHEKSVKHTYICGRCKTTWKGKPQKN